VKDDREIKANHAKRDEILMLVRKGRMSPSDADLWAAEHGEVFTQRNDSLEFNPMRQSDWTLPMVAAWIVERTAEAAREQWDDYRLRQYIWSPIWEEDEMGSELSPLGPSKLRTAFGGFGKVSEFPALKRYSNDISQFDPAYELAFSLQSGKLPAMGDRSARTSIPKEYWLPRQYPRHSQKVNLRDVNRDPIENLQLFLDDHGPNGFKSVRVSRDIVLGIWIPPRKIEGARTLLESAEDSIKHIPTLPPGFHRPDWTIEHVIAWISTRDDATLEALELADDARPAWYGQRYHNGLVDQISENSLREALITKTIVAFKGERVVLPEYWHENQIIDLPKIWFRRDQVQTRWPRRKKSITPEIDSLVVVRASDQTDTQPPQDFSFLEKPRKRGGPKNKFNAAKAILELIVSGKHTPESLYSIKQKAIADICGVGRTTAEEARKALLDDLKAQSNPLPATNGDRQ
jgi:hypothetical protein